MRRTRQTDTPAELSLRRTLHGRGLRYRIDRPAVRGIRSRPDIVFAPARVAVYVDGCFWHGCPDHGTAPKRNREWWQTKLNANKARDERATRDLTAAGWHVIRIWEHEDPEAAADFVADIVERRRRSDRLSRRC